MTTRIVNDRIVNQTPLQNISTQNIYQGISDNPHGRFCTLPGSFNPPRVIGREDVMKKLDEGFEQKARQIITGPSGVGKSFIAEAFGRQFRQATGRAAGAVEHVFLVLVNNFENFIDGYRRIATQVPSIQTSKSEVVDLLSMVQSWLDSDHSKSWLLILDNVDMATLDLPDCSRFLPTADSQQNRYILTTTHDREVCADDADIIELSDFSNEQAWQFLAPICSWGVKDSQIAPLALTLDCNARAIFSTSRFLKQFDTDSVELNNRIDLINEKHWRTLFSDQDAHRLDRIPALLSQYGLLWSGILEKAYNINASAMHALGILSCFDQCCTSHAVLEHCGNVDRTLSSCAEHVTTLKRYYLLSGCQSHQGPRVYRIRELVRMNCEAWSESHRPADNATWSHQDLWQHEALCALFKCYDKSNQPSETCDERTMISQAAAFSRYIKGRKPRIAMGEDLAKTFIQVAAVSSKAGQYEQSQTLLEHVVNSNPPKYWHGYALVDLAETIRSQRRNQNESALKTASDHLHAADRIAHELGKVNLRIKVGSALSLVCCDHQNFSEAIVYQELTLDLLKRQYNEHHIKYLEAQLVYGKVLHHDLQLDAAIEEVQSVVEGARKASEADYDRKSLLHSAEMTLARIHFSKGNHKTACNFAEKGYYGRCGLLGEQAFKTISAGVYFVCCLYKQHQSEEARKLSVNLMETARACHGQNNEQVLEWQEAMAMFHHSSE